MDREEIDQVEVLDVEATNEEVDGAIGEDEGAEDESISSYTKEQVEKIVKGRVKTYNSKIEKLSAYKNVVEQISSMTGLPAEELAHRLSALSVDQQAQVLGITPEQVKLTMATKSALDSEKKNNQTLSRQLEENTLKADTRFKDYDLFKEDIEAIVDENPKLTLRQAYLLAKGDDAITSAARDAEQRAIAKSVNAQTKKIVKTTSTPAPTAKLDPSIIAAAAMVGMDPVEYAKYMTIDSIDAHRANKKK